MGEIPSWVIEWFYAAVLVLAGIGVIFFGFKMIFRLILFVACLWLAWWSAINLGLIDEAAIKKQVESITSTPVVPEAPKAQ